MSPDQIASAADGCGIDATDLAHAYFVIIGGGYHDCSSMKDEFDAALHSRIGESYATRFLESLAGYEKLFSEAQALG